jgi:hypothetical protein
MANLRLGLIQALRASAHNIQRSSTYQWGHMGLCNCGFLAQQITSLSKEEIHKRAMQQQGDWSEQLNDYCPTSGLPMDNVIDELVEFGFTISELKHLERLSDPTILQRLPLEKGSLKYNVKEDVVTYLTTWAGLLEDSLLETISLPELANKEIIPIL